MNPAASKEDVFELQRFLDAQAGSYAQALAELREGEKRSHWMWFIFPQLEGLGSSPMALRYAIRSRAEAEAYLAHPILGSRLRECAQALLGVQGRPIGAILGFPDDLKLQSSMTIFTALEGADPVFNRVLERYYAGKSDAKTLGLLERLK